MPELPEVESFRRYFEETSLRQPIKDVELYDGRILSAPFEDLKEAVKGHAFTSTARLGKHLFIYTDHGRCLAVHFGMTGKLHYYKEKGKMPEYTCLSFIFENGFKLAYVCRRKWGRIGLANDHESFKAAKNLSTDAFEMSFEEFSKNLKNKRSPIKAVLLDQRVAAGVGNWVADEILFQAHIHPETRVNKLDEGEIKAVYDKMKYILKTAIGKKAVRKSLPDDFLVHHRKEGASCKACGKPIKMLKVGGRTTYFCPGFQKLKT